MMINNYEGVGDVGKGLTESSTNSCTSAAVENDYANEVI